MDGTFVSAVEAVHVVTRCHGPQQTVGLYDTGIGYRVLADTRQYLWVSVSADTHLSIGTDTSSPVIRLPVLTVNTVAHTPVVSSLYRTKK